MPIVFTYGCLMDPAVMGRVCGSARAVGGARLEGHRLAFPLPSDGEWIGAVAGAAPCEGMAVEGGLWEVDDAGLALLDAYEEIDDRAYRRERRPVARLDGGGSLDAWLYFANADPTVEDARPTPAYRDALLRGADHFNLTPAYRDTLRALPVADDPSA